MIATSFLCYEWLETNKCFAVLFSPRTFLKTNRLAESNKDHLPALFDLAIEAGIIDKYPPG